MTKKGKYIFACCSSVKTYHKSKSGGNKRFVDDLYINHFSNEYLIKHTITKHNIHIKTLSVMENSIKSVVDNYVNDSRIVRILCLRALRAYLISEDGAQIGRALFGSFVSFTSGLSVVPLTKSEIEGGAKVVSEYSLTDKNGKSICRSSWGLSPRSLSGTLVSSAFSTWFSYVRAAYNLEDSEGKYHKELACAASLLEYAKGGRVALSSAEKRAKKAKKAVSGLSAAELLATLSPEQISALAALAAANQGK